MPDDDELSKLKKEVAELKQKLDPPPRPPSTHQPYDPTANFSMPANALAAMVAAVPDSLMSDLRADALKPNPMTLSGGVTKPAATEPPKAIGKKGWIDQRPLEPPPGIAIMDQMMDAQDAQDRTELARKIAQARLAEEK
jgi:hypothetical protein